MNTQLRKGVIELCILALIAQKDMYGYDIVRAMEKYTDINEGTVYPILRRLTKDVASPPIWWRVTPARPANTIP